MKMEEMGFEPLQFRNVTDEGYKSDFGVVADDRSVSNPRVLYISMAVGTEGYEFHCGTANGVSNMVFLVVEYARCKDSTREQCLRKPCSR